MSEDSPLARAGRESAGDKYERHRAAARNLLREPLPQSARPRVDLVGEAGATYGFHRETRLPSQTLGGAHGPYRLVRNSGPDPVRTIAMTQVRPSHIERQIQRWGAIGAVCVALLSGGGLIGLLTAFFVSAEPTAILVATLTFVALVLAGAAIGVAAAFKIDGLDQRRRTEAINIDDFPADEANLAGHAVAALGEIQLSKAWQSGWLRAPREQIDLAAEAEAIMRSAGRLSDLHDSNGTRPETDGPQRDRWDALNEIRTDGLTALRERVVDVLALRLAVDDVADLIAEADELRRTDANLSRSDALAAQILTDIPEHARAADRLAELTAATGGAREILERELTARRTAIDTAAHALAERGELT